MQAARIQELRWGALDGSSATPHWQLGGIAIAVAISIAIAVAVVIAIAIAISIAVLMLW